MQLHVPGLGNHGKYAMLLSRNQFELQAFGQKMRKMSCRTTIALIEQLDRQNKLHRNPYNNWLVQEVVKPSAGFSIRVGNVKHQRCPRLQATDRVTSQRRCQAETVAG